ncbi:MAG: dodecin [Longimicrobiaceae bacterium]
MTHVYKAIELVGTSPDSFDAAVREAVARAAKKMRDLQWFEVVEQRGYLRDGGVNEFQVKVKVWFVLEDTREE